MELNSLLDGCSTLENTIAILVKNNATKQAELKAAQSQVIDRAQRFLDQLVDKERNLKGVLDELLSKRSNLESEIKHLSDTNDKLTELAEIAQRNEDGRVGAISKHDQYYVTTGHAIQDFEQLKSDYDKAMHNMTSLKSYISIANVDLKNQLESNRQLVVDLEKNHEIVRILEQQNKYAEQQFDLVLNQLPWEPLPETYLSHLEKSQDSSLRLISTNLRIQANEIRELTESLECKKERKLRILEELASELNQFIKRRGEVVLMDSKRWKQ